MSSTNASNQMNLHIGSEAETDQSQPDLNDDASDDNEDSSDARGNDLCDVCAGVVVLTEAVYCRACKQKLCSSCCNVHRNLTATKQHDTEACWPISRNLNEEQFEHLLMKHSNATDAAANLEEQTGLQICVTAGETGLQALAPFEDLLDIAFKDSVLDEAADNDSVSVRIERGEVHWQFAGYHAKVVHTLFNNDLTIVLESFPNVNASYIEGTHEVTGQSAALHSNKEIHTRQDKCPVLNISCDFDMFPTINIFIQNIVGKMKGLHKAEIERQLKDDYRVKLFYTVKETDQSVVCFRERDNTSVKLLIHGIDERVVQEAENEFLSLFCKECSTCHSESSSPVYLDCKHVMCEKCVMKTDSVTCGVCPDGQGRVTQVRSLQVQCLDLIEEIITSPGRQEPVPTLALHASEEKEGVGRCHPKRGTHSLEKNSNGKQQLSTRIPKYILQRWRRLSGGLTRLRSLLQNDYGLKVAGSDDNLKIYGNTYELLDLAIHSVEQLNQAPPDHGVTCTLDEKMVLWRFRGDYARITYFLFNKELRFLVDAMESVEMKCFTDFHPPVLNIKCAYDQYAEVKAKLDELVNAIAFLHEDEYIQPKTFYYNIKVREFLYSMRNNEHVFCNLRIRNNRNVIIIKTRWKEYINITKDKIANW